MNIEPEWISAIAACFGAAGIVFVAVQTFIARKNLAIAVRQLEITATQHTLTVEQFQADHEWSRREKAIEVLARWADSIDKAHPSARALVESFDHDQCQKLKSRKGFKIPAELADALGVTVHACILAHDVLDGFYSRGYAHKGWVIYRWS